MDGATDGVHHGTITIGTIHIGTDTDPLITVDMPMEDTGMDITMDTGTDTITDTGMDTTTDTGVLLITVTELGMVADGTKTMMLLPTTALTPDTMEEALVLEV